MKRLLWGLAVVLLVLVVAYGVLPYVASESGEVVVLATRDGAGAEIETRLWVVEFDGSQWLRASQAESGWLARLRNAPLVRVTRGSVTQEYRAQPDAGSVAEINLLMRSKYGWADRLIELLYGRSGSVAVRLKLAKETSGATSTVAA